jgi:general secretion pathway protein K
MMLDILPLSKISFNGPQRGAILIIVLWFIVIVSVIVAALASETRLSAKVVLHNKMGMQTWNDTLQALQAAQLELLINKMPLPPGEEEEVPLSERKSKEYRFDGRVLELAYPIPDTVKVRIYDHAGKINIQRLSKSRLRQLLEKRIGKDPEKLQALEDPWEDWIDRDDLKRLSGAEKDYYEELDPPYEPRNARLETVGELLLIKGFAEVFKGVEMDTAFTVYGNRFGVNPNLATREALMLIPGLDEGTINIILTRRREKEFKSISEFNEFMPPEQLSLVRSWINFAKTSNFYTIAVQVKKPEEIEKSETEEETADTEALDEEADETEEADKTGSQPAPEKNQRAYMVTVQPKGYNQLPKILMVNPYGVLPDTRHEHMSIDVDENSGFGNQWTPSRESDDSFEKSTPSSGFPFFR